MPSKRRKKSVINRLLRWLLLIALFLYAALSLALASLRWINPFTTSVQTQRRVESWIARTRYQKQYTFVPIARISKHLQHAVIAAEDGRFYSHNGIDWKEVEKVIDDELENGRLRGASTITQQLLKNLFFTTGGSIFRKASEYATAPVAEVVLSKQRILELYLNVIEWGSGVFGAEAAARHHYGVSAADLSREQAARLAAILPNPIRRRPARMDRYTGIILERMSRMGW